ncbi:MAG: radical SAM protein [Clostridia bacterium]|nr:radical SAM protein [Clostridia bacterium]
MNYKFSKFNLIIDKKEDTILLYNSFTGSFCELDVVLYNKIKDNNCISSAIEYYDLLKEEGIIVPNLLDEYHQVIAIERERMYKHNPESVYVVVALTLACNMQCEYCFESKQYSTKKIDSNVVEDIISSLKRQIDVNTNLKTLAVSWFGGEPLLGYNEILKICDQIVPYCEKHNVKFISSMISNGLLLTDDKITALIERCNLTRIQITLDGLEETYCKVISFINKRLY